MTSPHFQIHNLIEILGETVNPSKETIQQIKFGLESIQSKLDANSKEQHEELDKLREDYEKKIGRALGVIQELENEIDRLKQEKDREEVDCSSILIQDESEKVKPDESPLEFAKSNYIQSLINLQVDERLHEVSQNLDSKNRSNQLRIKQLEDELQARESDVEALVAEIEQWKAKAALLESRNKELVQKKSGMFEELQHVRERQEALGEHNHKLLDEARINSQLITGLQEKLDGYKELNIELEREIVELLTRLRRVESENIVLGEKVAELKEGYETKIRIIRDSHKLSQHFTKRGLLKQKRSKFEKRKSSLGSFNKENYDPNILHPFGSENTKHSSFFESLKREMQPQAREGLSAITKTDSEPGKCSLVRFMSSEESPSRGKCLRDEIQDMPSISPFEHTNEFLIRPKQSVASPTRTSPQMASTPTQFLPSVESSACFKNRSQTMPVHVHQKSPELTLNNHIEKHVQENIKPVSPPRSDTDDLKNALERKEILIGIKTDLAAEAATTMQQIQKARSQTEPGSKLVRQLPRTGGQDIRSPQACLGCTLI